MTAIWAWLLERAHIWGLPVLILYLLFSIVLLSMWHSPVPFTV